MPRRLLVTSALPYANGHIHLGHMVEYLQTDIWVRFQKLRGHDCRYFCADDTHGTAIMIRARQEGRPEEAVIAEMQQAHQRDFADFGIEFDNYGSTHSAENRQLCGEFWAAIRQAGLVKEQDVEQLFDEQAGTFLADRFVRGTCPKCKAADQPGDNCSACGHHYGPIDLIDPVSTLSGSTPVVRIVGAEIPAIMPPHTIYERVQLVRRETGDPWTAEETWRAGCGACRDLAVLFVETCRLLGVAARFVSGYEFAAETSDAFDLHAWAEAYVPGVGWRGFDPSRGLATTQDHVAVAAAATPQGAAPVIGAFRGDGATATITSELNVDRHACEPAHALVG